MGVAAFLGDRTLSRPEVYALPVGSPVVTKGFYVARKSSWRSTASYIVVMVMHDEYDELRVHEPGKPGHTHPHEWEFRDRIMGLKEATAHYTASMIRQVS